jgi:hypothetical protein
LVGFSENDWAHHLGDDVGEIAEHHVCSRGALRCTFLVATPTVPETR